MAMNEYSLADLAAATGNREGGFGDGNGAWWLLVLFALLGGFGNNGWNNGGGAGGVGGNELYPWLNQSQNVNDGFRDQMLQTNVQGIQQGINNLSTQLCNGFNQSQLGVLQSVNGLQAQLAQHCCDNQLATANQTATILAENCADRAALSDGVRDIIASQVAGDQRIIDKLCQLEMDGYKREAEAERRANDQLRAELTQARFDASQQAQNAYIQQGFANEVDQLYNRLNNCPVPSMPVYGRTPIFTCQSQNSCGCGCGNM